MNRYDIEKVVGEGSYGKALLCRRKSDRERCIIKQISISKMKPKEVKQTEQESCLLSKFSHPNIVAFWESFSTPTHLFIVMEYADGGDLDRYVKSMKGRTIPEQSVLNLFVQISLAMKHVHDRKILHRDLKCQNVFLTSKGICKLGDFGVSRVLQGTMEMAATQIGTPYYMSPEIMEGKVYNSKTDIWSLAIILYELLCLRVPFDGQNMRQLCYNIINAKPSPPSSTYSKEVHELLFQMLQKNPRQRPSINSILSKDVIKRHVQRLLDENVMRAEFNHTVLHGVNIMDRNYNPNSVPSTAPNAIPVPSPKPSPSPPPISNPNPNPARAPSPNSNLNIKPSVNPPPKSAVEPSNPNNKIVNNNGNNNNMNYNRAPSPNNPPSVFNWMNSPAPNQVQPKAPSPSPPPAANIPSAKVNAAPQPPKEVQSRIDAVAEMLAEKKRQQELIQKQQLQLQQQKLQQLQQLQQQQQQLILQQQRRNEAQPPLRIAVHNPNAYAEQARPQVKQAQEPQRAIEINKANKPPQPPAPAPAPAQGIQKKIERQDSKPIINMNVNGNQLVAAKLPPQPPASRRDIIVSGNQPDVVQRKPIERAHPEPKPISNYNPHHPSAKILNVGKAKEADVKTPEAASYLKPRGIDVLRAQQRQEELRLQRLAKLQKEKEDREREEEEKKRQMVLIEGGEVGSESDIKQKVPQQGSKNVIVPAEAPESPRLPKSEWIHQMKLKMGQLNSDVNKIEIKTPTPVAKDIIDDSSCFGLSDSDSDSDSDSKLKGIKKSTAVKPSPKFEIPIKAGKQDDRVVDKRKVDSNINDIRPSNVGKSDSNVGGDPTNQRRLNLNGLESKMEALKKQMDVMKAFQPPSAPVSPRVAVIQSAPSANKAGLVRPSSAGAVAPLLKKSSKSAAGDDKAANLAGNRPEIKKIVKKKSDLKSGPEPENGKKAKDKKSKPSTQQKEKEKQSDKQNDNRKPISASELRAIRDLERENLRQLMRQKRKEVNSDKVEIDIKYNNYFAVDEDGDDVRDKDLSENENKSEDNDSILESNSVSLASTQELAQDLKSISKSEISVDLKDESNVSEDRSVSVDTGARSISSDDSSDAGSDDSLTYGDSFGVDDMGNNDTMQYEGSCFEHIDRGQEDIAARDQSPSLEYSILLKQMQAILQLPNVKSKTVYAPSSGLDSYQTIEIGEMSTVQMPSIGARSDNDSFVYSEDSDEFGEEEEHRLYDGSEDAVDKTEDCDVDDLSPQSNQEHTANEKNQIDFYISGGDGSIDLGDQFDQISSDDLGKNDNILPGKSNFEINSPVILSLSEKLDLFKEVSYHGVNTPLSLPAVRNEFNELDEFASDDGTSDCDVVVADDVNSGVDLQLNDSEDIKQFLYTRLGESAVQQAIELLRAVDTLIPSSGAESTAIAEAEDAFLEQIEGIVGQEGLEYIDLLYKLVISM